MPTDKKIPQKGKGLLVIRFSAMGDVAMTVPVIRALEQRYPDLPITVLTRSFFAPMFKQLSHVRVYGADLKGRHKGILGLWRLYKEIKPMGFQAVADLHNVLRTKILKFFFLLGGTPLVQIDKGRKAKRALTRKSAKILKPLKTTHERYADVFAHLGFPVKLSNALALSTEELSPGISKLMGPKEGKWLGMAPFAAFVGKAYPMDLMEGIIQEILNTKKYTIVLFGGGRTEVDQLDALSRRYGRCINVSGKFSFAEELALISSLDVLVGMDSANGHLAAMYGVPVITLWGITHPYAGFAPFGQPRQNALLADRGKYPLIPTSVYGNWRPEGYEDVMRTISVEKVVSRIHQICEVK